ncbi:hypothetical protein TCAL_09680 [Tigriopus californicus]|uniref:Peptidase M12B domain-containing protein n=1 Tax=Tigriopus californicus TaxID=6832 RepID=A0A553NYZ3_TIGCA|nr:hypothetical protein TCAL_09680 [Tigriopus californicus]
MSINHIVPSSSHPLYLANTTLRQKQDQAETSKSVLFPASIVARGRFKLSAKHETKRSKRDVEPPEDDTDDYEAELELSTDEPIWGHDLRTYNLKLTKSPQLLAPQYELVVRNGQNISVNRTVPFPTCLYSSSHSEHIPAALSTCQGNALKGILIANGSKLILEEIPPQPGPRPKRSLEGLDGGSSDNLGGLIVIYEAEATGGECGIKPENLQRMHAPTREAILLKPHGSITKQKPKPSVGSFVRKKRSPRGDKTIELAVFVDDDLYKKEKELHSRDAVFQIQDLVFTYLNSVQLLYNSEKLDYRVKVVLVRLEIFKTPISGIDKSRGDIEQYLDSFCGWQRDENPGDSPEDDLSNSAHWDHGLLLTGLNLFDRQPKYDSVIGLAWVSGMCHPSYSCTINEGSNFESVYVIAHEMGHNLGMNHDGESRAGNTCDPDKYLMSPILGPGKVSWSTCSNQEISDFITAGVTRNQAKCLDDMPEIMAKYDYLKDSKAPGDKFKAIEQCQKAFGQDFKPHKKDEKPFEDLCRELWCSNNTHALRAHPALEGTDCSEKPFPYGSICLSGICSPFDPNDDGTRKIGDDNEVNKNDGDQSTVNASANKIDDRPTWLSERYPKSNGQTRVLPLQTKESSRTGPERNDQAVIFPRIVEDFGHPEWIKMNKLHRETSNYFKPGVRWVTRESTCPVECGAGWTDVQSECLNAVGNVIEDRHCTELLGPKTKLSRKLCNIEPC